VERLQAIVRDKVLQVRTEKVVHLISTRAIDQGAKAFKPFLRCEISGQSREKFEQDLRLEVLPEPIDEKWKYKLVLVEHRRDGCLRASVLHFVSAGHVECLDVGAHPIYVFGAHPLNLAGESADHVTLNCLTALIQLKQGYVLLVKDVGPHDIGKLVQEEGSNCSASIEEVRIPAE